MSASDGVRSGGKAGSFIWCVDQGIAPYWQTSYCNDMSIWVGRASVRSVLSSWPRRVAGSEVGLGSHMTGWAGRGTYTRKFEAPASMIKVVR